MQLALCVGSQALQCIGLFQRVIVPGIAVHYADQAL